MHNNHSEIRDGSQKGIVSHMRPTVSIVTPSYNCAAYIEETLQSVQEQTYSRIEHIDVDGASHDDTVAILKRHESQITWISEPDDGMYDAINKGFALASGEIFTYINADDLYFNSDVVHRVVEELTADDSVDFVYGNCAFIDDVGRLLYTLKAPFFNRRIALAYPSMIFQQPTCFWRRRVHRPFDPSFHYVGDAHFFRYLCENYVGRNVGRTLARFRLRPDCLSFAHAEKMSREAERVFGKAAEWHTPFPLWLFKVVYIRTILNWRANLKRLQLRYEGRPYL